LIQYVAYMSLSRGYSTGKSKEDDHQSKEQDSDRFYHDSRLRPIDVILPNWIAQASKRGRKYGNETNSTISRRHTTYQIFLELVCVLGWGNNFEVVLLVFKTLKVIGSSVNQLFASHDRFFPSLLNH